MVSPTPFAIPNTRWLWLRLSWRDLRSRWVAVVAIALVLAIGTGVFAGLGSTATWRRQSNDASFAALGMHDLRVTLSPGTFVEQGSLAGVVDSLDAAAIEVAAERLIVDSQVAASTDEGPILLAARVVGMAFGADPAVDDVWVETGVAPQPGVTGEVGLLETKFADFYGLPAQGSITLAGGYEVTFVGHGIAPEEFFYEGPEGSFFGEGELAIVYLPLTAAQDASGRAGEVNDVVIRLAEGVDRDQIEAQLIDAVDQLNVSATVATQDDAVAFRLLYDDIENDQTFWNALSALVLLAAALAAFNLVSRIVEAQRREIGIGMALGVSRWRLAIRPLLIGIQVGLLGTIAGVGVGLLIGQAMENLLRTFLPMPIWLTEFQFGVFARAAALGLLVPLLASAVPVLRATRVEPIDAIRTGHLTAKTNRVTDWTGRIRLPGTSLNQMPFRNVVRNPRRIILTALGVGAAITALVAVLGLLDSFVRAVDEAGAELTKGDPDRVLVQLDTFYDAEGDVVATIGQAPSVGSLDPALRLPVTAVTGGDGEQLDLLIELLDFETATWTPTLDRGTASELGDGIALARKAADDLGVAVGDPLALRHPVRSEAGQFALIESEFRVGAIHANPLRTFAYLDLSQAERFGLVGMANVVHAYPGPDATRTDLRGEVFGLPGVTSSQAAGRISEGFDEALSQMTGILFITAAAVLILALLIAFNSTRITVEERRREHATMRAFGLPVRSVIGVVIKESVLVGVVATAIGLIGGLFFMNWMLRTLATTTVPDLGIDLYLSPTTLGLSLVVGVLAVAVAPLFLIRQVRRMDLPATLRVVE